MVTGNRRVTLVIVTYAQYFTVLFFRLSITSVSIILCWKLCAVTAASHRLAYWWVHAGSHWTLRQYGSSVSSGERGDRPIIHEIVRSSIISDETFQRLLWLSEETEKLAIQDILYADTQLQFTATNVTCKGLTVARRCPIIHGDRKSMSYSTYK